ncbi:MAG: hypothetical protein H6Q03_1627 [Acidobacteria bacterium]|nr:hypothetical protein [Acidobacteriota bacterium]
MPRPSPRTLSILAAAGFVVALAGHLLDPGRVLGARDLAQFHLPLRATLARLAAGGLPEWNPWIGGGQPVLSDPSYSAFYPPTWLALALPAAWALSLLAVIHLALAAAGAWTLARRLGCRSLVALFATVAWTGSGALLSFAHAFTLLLGAAWLPWALAATEALLAAPEPRARWRARLALAAVFAALLLNGEPVTTLCAGLAAGLWALGRAPLRAVAGAFGSVALAALLAAALAAVQLVPALARLAGSARAGGLAWETAASWSLPPARALELIEPRAFGDPLRFGEGLHFGWGIHDRAYPFVISLYPGLVVLVLGAAGLLRAGIPGRRAWLAIAALGAVLALGRHLPVYELLFRYLPPFSSVRYPEKFVLLAGAALVFAAALELERRLAEREAGRRGGADLPLALAGVVAALAAAAAMLVRLAPERIEDFAAAHSGLPAGARVLADARAFYERESELALVLALATLAVLVALRLRRPAAGALAAALVALAAADLLVRHRPLLATLPASAYQPPALALELPAGPGRLWSSANFDDRPELVLRGGDARFRDLTTRVERLDPWTGATWGVAYALSTDFALTFTPPLRRAVAAAERLWREEDRERFYRLLGAWGVTRTVLRKGPAELAAEVRAGTPAPAPARLGASPYALPTARFVSGAEAFADPEAALETALAEGLPLAEREFVTGAGWTGVRRFDGRARVLSWIDRARTLELEVAAGGDALLVVATTWDPFWSAEVDGAPARPIETAAGYLALPVPAGARRVRLAYRDPWLRVGAAASAATLLAAAALALASRRRAR